MLQIPRAAMLVDSKYKKVLEGEWLNDVFPVMSSGASEANFRVKYRWVEIAQWESKIVVDRLRNESPTNFLKAQRRINLQSTDKNKSSEKVEMKLVEIQRYSHHSDSGAWRSHSK